MVTGFTSEWFRSLQTGHHWSRTAGREGGCSGRVQVLTRCDPCQQALARNCTQPDKSPKHSAHSTFQGPLICAVNSGSKVNTLFPHFKRFFSSRVNLVKYWIQYWKSHLERQRGQLIAFSTIYLSWNALLCSTKNLIFCIGII